MREDLKEHYYNLVRGAIFGQAIGDALGHPIEFQKTHEVVDLVNDNKFTDDTQMFCAIGEAMLDAPPHKNEDQFMDALTKRFVDWRQNPLGGTHRAPGGTCMEGVRRLSTGRHWRQTGVTSGGKGNGSAMRAGIVGARYWKRPYYAFRIGCLTSVNTHNNLESILAAGMVAFLVAKSISATGWTETVAEGIEICADFETQVPDYPTNNLPLNDARDGQSPWKVLASFSRAFILADTSMTTEEFVKVNGDDFTAVPAVAEVIHYNTLTNGITDMLLWSANHSDDSDTVTAITGTIAGARFGFDQIDPEWTGKIEMREYLEDLSKRIFDASEDEDSEENVAGLGVEEALGEDYIEGDEIETDGIEPMDIDLPPVVLDGDFDVEF